MLGEKQERGAGEDAGHDVEAGDRERAHHRAGREPQRDGGGLAAPAAREQQAAEGRVDREHHHHEQDVVDDVVAERQRVGDPDQQDHRQGVLVEHALEVAGQGPRVQVVEVVGDVVDDRLLGQRQQREHDGARDDPAQGDAASLRHPRPACAVADEAVDPGRDAVDEQVARVLHPAPDAGTSCGGAARDRDALVGGRRVPGGRGGRAHAAASRPRNTSRSRRACAGASSGTRPCSTSAPNSS